MRLRTGVLLALFAVTAGCGGDADGFSVIESPDYALPGETLEDWVSFGDQLSVITVLDATGPATPPDFRNSGGLIGRRVRVRVDRTLWRRPDAPRTDGTLRFDVWGWAMESDQDANSPRRPLISEGTARLEVGRRYLTVLVRLRGEWHPLTDRAVMTLSAGGVVTSEVLFGEPSPGARALEGLPLRAAAARLAATPPDPIAARYADLPPRRRWLAVARKRS